MKNNRYLRELGVRWDQLPGNYNSKLQKDCPAADRRNKLNKEGFCEYEFFSLDYSLALYIYPRLCYFRDNCAKWATPAFFTFNEDGTENPNGNKEWIETINKMCLAFRLIITDPADPFDFKEVNKKIEEGLSLFAKYYRSLWT